MRLIKKKICRPRLPSSFIRGPGRQGPAFPPQRLLFLSGVRAGRNRKQPAVRFLERRRTLRYRPGAFGRPGRRSGKDRERSGPSRRRDLRL